MARVFCGVVYDTDSLLLSLTRGGMVENGERGDIRKSNVARRQNNRPRACGRGLKPGFQKSSFSAARICRTIWPKIRGPIYGVDIPCQLSII